MTDTKKRASDHRRKKEEGENAPGVSGGDGTELFKPGATGAGVRLWRSGRHLNGVHIENFDTVM